MREKGEKMDFQQSQTYTNLQNAFERELMLSALFIIYSDIARQEGYQQIGNIYDIFSRNNREHARIWLRQLNEGSLPNTTEALAMSIVAENLNGNQLYREYSQTAKEEGYNNIEALFNGVGNIDLNHGLQLDIQYDDILRNSVFCKDEATLWICMQCGNIMNGECAPVICPVCGFPQGFYRLYRNQLIQ